MKLMAERLSKKEHSGHTFKIATDDKVLIIELADMHGHKLRMVNIYNQNGTSRNLMFAGDTPQEMIVVASMIILDIEEIEKELK